MTQKIAALQVATCAITGGDHLNGDLKFFESLFEEVHFFVCEAKIVMSFVVAIRDRIRLGFGGDSIFLENFG